MVERASTYWRVCATGLCFSSFGLGGLLLRVLVFPLLWVVVWQRHRRALVARWVLRHTFRGFVGLMRVLGVISCEMHGIHKLQRHGLLILANHPSLIDVVLLMSVVPRADCIVKSAVASNPFMRGPVRAAGYVVNDSGAGLVQGCIDSVRAGNNLIVFPEGTRTPYGPGAEPPRLQRGAANVAVRGRISVTPVRIHMAPPMLRKGEKWWRVPPRRGHFTVSVGDDIAVEPFISGAPGEAVAARRLTDHLADYFLREIPRAGT
jgi:1-acyl-sn-glycerol-3-phosphate acyltransferase